MPEVFISYYQNDDNHRRRVRTLAEDLRNSGANVVLDEFYLEAHPGGPPEGWDTWCAQNSLKAEYVIIIGSKEWFQRFENKIPPRRGLGAAREAVDIRSRIHAAKGLPNNIRVVVFADVDLKLISTPFDLYQSFHAERDFGKILEWLGCEQSLIANSPVASTSRMERFKEKLERIVFPTVQFSNATLDEAIEYLRIKSRDFDSDESDAKKRGVNLFLDRDLERSDLSLNLDLKNVPMIEALRYISELAGIEFEIGSSGVRIMRRVQAEVAQAAATPRLKLRTETTFQKVGAFSRAQAEGDNPSLEDHFGRERFVEPLGYFLTRSKTGTPLTVSIEAPWGAGKSSFMRQLESQVLRSQDTLVTTKGIVSKAKRWLKDKFVRDAPITMWFNPWRHAEAEAMWAAFALEFARRIRQQSVFVRRWGWAQLSLWLQTYDWARGFPEIVRLASRVMALCLAGLILWFASKYGLEALDGVCRSLGEWAKLDEGKKTPAALIEKFITGETGTLAVALVTVIGLVLQLSSALGNPLVPANRKYLTKQDQFDVGGS